MKAFKKIIPVLLTVIILLTTVCSLGASAAGSVSVGGGNFNLGQTFSVKVSVSNSDPIIAAQISISYNAGVLTLTGVSGSDYTTGNGTINIVDDDFSTATKEVKSGSYTLTFKAAAEGSTNISVTASIAPRTGGKVVAKASSAVKVTKPAPSSNANLVSLKVSDATLSPAFSANTTSYTATVKYPIEKVTVSASVADGGATCVGAGEMSLQVGENSKTITVTAPSGAKKSYTVVIKRLNEDETAALIEQERAADPTLVVMDGVDFHIKSDLADVAIPDGFTATTTKYKEGELAAITDVANKYTLCYITADDGSRADWAYTDTNGEFVFLNYVSVNNKIYILEDAVPSFTIPSSYTDADYEAASGTVKAFKSIHEELADFYIFNCYVDGENAFYRYDTAKNTIQRAPDFELASTLETAAKAEQNKNIFTRFLAMNTAGKAIILLVCIAVIVVIVLIVLLVIKLVNRPEKPMEFIPVSADNEISSTTDNNPFDIFSVTENGKITESSDEVEKTNEIPDEDDDF